MSSVRLSILVAMAANRAIGNHGALPWYLPADLKHFKSLTMGKTIIMGRRTHESIGRPLPGRQNIIITRKKNYCVEGAIVAHSVKEALQICENDRTLCDENFIIGGADIYRQTIDLSNCMYITEIQQCFDGDTFFPHFNPNEWVETSCEKHAPGNGNDFAYHFVKFNRISQLTE